MTARRRSGAAKRPHVIVLGPQGDSPTLPAVCEDLVADGRLARDGVLATITAGWQEREGELGRLEADTGRKTLDLGLYARAETVAEEDPELAAGHTAVQSRLKELRRAYNRRLAGAMTSLAELNRLEGDATVLDAEREDALEELRRLDARHLARVAELRAAYLNEFAPHDRPVVRQQRRAIGSALKGVDVVAIAGGHVATLLNRLRLFDVAPLLAKKTIVAWSAGAMVLGERVALFHDRPPWGPGNAEMFEHGLGVLEGVMFFPHATRRLDLEDVVRTRRLARRFAPDTCVLLDPGSRMAFAADGTMSASDAFRLAADGSRSPADSRAA